jgi:hypothetical protein
VTSHSASEVIATYALRTKDELERTLPLDRDDELLAAFSVVTQYTGSSILAKTRRGYLRLSTKRLCVLRHYGFLRDRIIVIPPGAITSIEGQWPHSDVRISFCGERGGAVVTLRTGVRRERNDTALNSDDVPMPFRHIIDAIGLETRFVAGPG